MKVKVESKWNIELADSNAESRDHFADHCFSVLDALVEMTGSPILISEADLSLNFSDNCVSYEFTVNAGSLDEAKTLAGAAMRAAVHAAGGFTATWDNNPLQLRLTEVEDSQAAPTLTFTS